MTSDNLPLLRGSERKDFKRCPQRWWWGWRDGLEPTKRKLPLWFGTGIHLGFEKWYIPGTDRGIDPRETWVEYVGDVMEKVKVEVLSGHMPDGATTAVMDAKGVGLAMLDNYLDTFGNDDEWEILSPEQTFAVRIPGPDREPIAKFLGTFDIVARHLGTGKIWLWDHKTAKSIKTNHLPLDDQAGGYWAVADTTLRRQGKIGRNERISGILYNFLMKAPPDERPLNEKGQATNKPKKSHYVDQILAHEAKQFIIPAGPGKGSIQPQWLEELGPAREKALNKMKVDELDELAFENDLTVLGDVSLQQPSPRFHREEVYRTSKERRKQIQHIAAEVEHMNAVRDGRLPLFKNPTRDCTWDCDFYDLCLADENGGDTDLLIQVGYRVRDPYEAHRVDHGEF